MSTLLRTLTIAAVLALVLAACGEETEPAATGGDEDEATEPAAADEETPAAEDEETPAAEDDETAAADVMVASSDLGDILVDAEGMTLYMFDPDEGGESTCYDDCEANWPPLVVDGEPTGGEGVDAALLGTTEREDGSMQVTYDSWPLYTFAADEAAGDTNGQGVNDVWWVMGPDGEAIHEDAEAAANSRSDY